MDSSIHLPSRRSDFMGDFPVIPGRRTALVNQQVPRLSSRGVSVAIEPMPLVSCILATRTRRPFLKQAIKYFLRQTYKEKELIIIDDDQQSAAHLIPENMNI